MVTEYLRNSGLQPYLDQLGFNIVGYGCTTCIGNSGPLDPAIEEAVISNDVIAASVLSGNRNFEARIHPNIRANFLASPPLVVAYALAGSMKIDLASEPLGEGKDGQPVFSAGTYVTTDESPLKERWGGWYVTGTHGAQRHMRGDARRRELVGRVDLADIAFVSKHIDEEPELVLEHEAGHPPAGQDRAAVILDQARERERQITAHTLAEEREILRKAAVFFAKEGGTR